MFNPKKFSGWSKAQAKRRVPLLKLSILQVLIILCVIALGSFTVYALNLKPRPQKPAAPSSSPAAGTNNGISAQAYKPVTAPASPIAAPAQPAIVSSCTNANEVALNGAYKTADSVFVGMVTGILNQTDLTDAQQVNNFNQAILATNGKYIDAYGQYQVAQKNAGCAVAVSPRTLLPICNPPTIDSFSVSNCIINTHLQD